MYKQIFIYSGDKLLFITTLDKIALQALIFQRIEKKEIIVNYEITPNVICFLNYLFTPLPLIVFGGILNFKNTNNMK